MLGRSCAFAVNLKCGFKHIEGVPGMALTHKCRITLSRRSLFLLIAVPMIAWGQILPSKILISNHAVVNSTSPYSDNGAVKNDLDSCRVYRVTSLPGSHHFASDFIEAIADDPDSSAKHSDTIWGLTADLSSETPFNDRALYISKSTDGGAKWIQVARIDSRYFDAGIGEGLRNGFSVSPDGSYFVITTQRGAFQVFPQSRVSTTVVKAIAGPRVPDTPPKIPIPKKPGDPVRANVVGIAADGKHLIVGYGYFDLDPQIFTYHRGSNDSWVEDGPLPRLPTEMDILSMQFDHPENPDPAYLYVGTGDQVYRFDRHAKSWSRIDGVGPDSAIHGMSVVGGLHLAACWGVYNPAGPHTEKRVTDASFLLHPEKDEAGPNLRAYSIEVDPSNTSREIVTSITGVYISADSGSTWRRLNDLPEEEFRTAHFNPDGTVLVSGISGTFLINPFSDTCAPHLRIRGQ